LHSTDADDVEAKSQDAEFDTGSVNEADEVRADSRNSLGFEVVIEEINGRSKRKRVRREADALNGCLCGKVLDDLTDLDGVLKCNQAGCETRWVSKFNL
jgi:hypothetical protein